VNALAAPIEASEARPAKAAIVRQRMSRDDLLLRLLLVLLIVWLAVAVVLPLWALLSKAFKNADGAFVGLANFAGYFANASLVASIANTLTVGILSTLICVALAFAYAYALTRTLMPGRGIFRVVAQLPLLAPSLLPAIGLVYLFGNKGIVREALLGASIYGPIGIVIGEVFWTFPHALIILITALSLADARLYEAAAALKAKPARVFWTVTLPGARYGLMSAFFVVFTLTVTDFGVPKVIGGQFNVLATDIYKQVVGQQNFEMGAVVGVLLLVPAVLAFLGDRIVQRRQAALLSARAVAFEPKRDRRTETIVLVIVSLIALAILAILGMAVFASFARLWPYNLAPTLKNYAFDMMDGGGWSSYRNSLVLAALTAIIGTAVVFLGAYLIEKTPRVKALRGLGQLLAIVPLAVPGLVLGLGYIFFFNAPGNPLGLIYGTMAILVICTIAHFYSVAHLTAVTALKQIDPEFETVAASLRVPVWRTFFLVTLPVSLPALLDIAIYLFVNAMTTVSALVFIYAPDTTLAAIAVLNMDDAGDVAPAAAMATLILATSAVIRIAYGLATGGLLHRSQRWRKR
jgi:iron(III) transport system permease protein